MTASIQAKAPDIREVAVAGPGIMDAAAGTRFRSTLPRNSAPCQPASTSPRRKEPGRPS